jgi:hypothetical protein
MKPETDTKEALIEKAVVATFEAAKRGKIE